MTLTPRALAALRAAIVAGRVQRGFQPRQAARRGLRRPRPPARRAALGGRQHLMPVIADVRVVSSSLEDPRARWSKRSRAQLGARPRCSWQGREVPERYIRSTARGLGRLADHERNSSLAGVLLVRSARAWTPFRAPFSRSGRSRCRDSDLRGLFAAPRPRNGAGHDGSAAGRGDDLGEEEDSPRCARPSANGSPRFRSR
jgi:hypothetical protein